MMLGEVEYDDLFRNSTNDPVLLPISSHIMVGLFIVMSSMILMNVLFGLAVADIQVSTRSIGLNTLMTLTTLMILMTLMTLAASIYIKKSGFFCPEFLDFFLDKKNLKIKIFLCSENGGRGNPEFRWTQLRPSYVVGSREEIA